MATTIAIFDALEADSPSSAYGFPAVRTTGVSVLKFVQGSANSVIFKSLVPAGVTIATMNVILWWSSSTATTGNVVWGGAVDNTTSHSIDTDSYGLQSTVTSTTSGTAAKPTSATLTITTGNQQSLAVEQPYKLQIQRVGTSGSDTMADVASLILVEVTM